MSKDEHSIKSVVEQVIKEEVPRIIQQLAMGVRYPYLGALAQGCCADKGCCRVQGCCGDQGCCVKQKGVMELIRGSPCPSGSLHHVPQRRGYEIFQTKRG